MKQRHALTRLAVPLGFTVLLLCARLFSAPALSDPVAGAAPPSLRLAVPWLYLALAPLFTMWDGVSMLSMVQLQGFLIGLVGLYVAWRIARLLWRERAPVSGAKPGSPILKEIRILAVSLLLLAAFLVGGAVWHRPMLALTGADPRDMVVDFHSHTNVSHDVRNTLMRGFDTKANLRWHTRAGFDATFITDHNEVSRGSGVGSRELEQRPVTSPPLTAPREQRLVGSQPWKRGAVTFEITNRLQEVDLMCELRASQGQAWFDLDSLRVVRVE